MANFNELRQKAEKKIDEMSAVGLPHPAVQDMTHLLEELRIYQVELEIQNQELRQTQQQLEQSREAFRDLYESAPVGYFTLDPAGHIVSVNRLGAVQLGRDRRALLNQRFVSFVAQPDREAFYLLLRRLLRSQTGQSCELRLMAADGSTFDALLESRAALDLVKSVIQIRMAVLDISARKRMEAELEAYRHHLEATVAARTADLSRSNERLQAEIEERRRAEADLTENNRRLEQALAELKTAQTQIIRQERLAAVGQLAAGIAHDFNNILTVIIGHAALLELEAEQLGPDNQSSIETIVRQGNRAADLVSRILDFSRQSVYRSRLVELGEFLSYAVSFLRRTIPEHIQIRVEIGPGLYLIQADPTQLQQVLTNLVVNARDAMPEGGEIVIRLFHCDLRDMQAGQPPPCPEMTPGRWIGLTVADSGAGMPAEVVHRIFEPFFTTKPVGQGTGLGLAQVYGIVHRHEGCVSVESAPDAGTTFTLYFPVDASAEVQPASASIPELPHGQGQGVLVVEDEGAVLQMVSTLLEKLDYRVLRAGSGREAIDIYNLNPDDIAVVLTDMVMPEMDGTALIQHLQAINPQVKIIILSGYPHPKPAELLEENGVLEWLQKPPQLAELAEALQQALQSSSDPSSPTKNC